MRKGIRVAVFVGKALAGCCINSFIVLTKQPLFSRLLDPAQMKENQMVPGA